MEAHHDGDCVLNFVDCPLFKVGMCTDECTGRIRIEDAASHSVADEALTSRLVDEILRLRGSLEEQCAAKHHVEPEVVTEEVESQKKSCKLSSLEDFFGPGESGEAGAVPLSETSLRKLFVGNLAFEATESCLRGLFEQFGRIEQVFLPVTASGYAFVTMSTSEEAQRALEGTANASLNGLTLRITLAKKDTLGGAKRVCYEWENRGSCRNGDKCMYTHTSDGGGKNPIAMTEQPLAVPVPPSTPQRHIIEPQMPNKRPRVEDSLEPGEVATSLISTHGDDTQQQQGRSLYVGHLAFATTEERLRALFSQYGEVKRVFMGGWWLLCYCPLTMYLVLKYRSSRSAGQAQRVCLCGHEHLRGSAVGCSPHGWHAAG
jgi:RNA recognition motif-containing protein